MDARLNGSRLSTLFDRSWLNNWRNLDLSSALLRRIPVSCRLCGAPARGFGVCDGCKGDLPWLSREPRRVDIRAVDSLWAAFRYRYPIDQMIHAAKFHGDTSAMFDLARLMVEALPRFDPGPGVLVPVPLHSRRLIRRGFNQALELARPLGARVGAVVHSGAVKRIASGPAQAGLPAAARRRNLRDAFKAHGGLTGCHVVIVDDVLTTGSTVAAVADVLRKHGARRIDAWVCAQA